MDQVEIRSPKSREEWKKYDDFRWEVLRKPLKMSHIPLKDNLESISYHYMAVNISNNILACGRVHMNSKNEAQIRYMGVSFDVRRMGIGASIVEKLEEKAKSLGATYVVLNARNVALDFYKSLGYNAIEPYESDIKIPHTKMEKILT
jgi:predicted GNAT family N-acyltransferase